MSGMYKVTANFKHSYLRIEAMKSATELATLNEDGSGAIWAIGGILYAALVLVVKMALRKQNNK